jgi:GAF domain-containing protein
VTGGPLREAVAAVARFLVADAPLGETLDRIAAHAKAGVTHADAVGMTLVDERGRATRTQIFTDDLSPEVDQGQYDEDTGPCLDALRKGDVILVEDTSAPDVTERWSAFSRLAQQCGVTSTLSVPLEVGSDRIGVMNLYGRGAPFTEDDAGDARVFATQAAAVLVNTRTYWGAFDLAVGLQTAIETRGIIEMAKGKLMGTSGCSADEAFAMLVKASQRENLKLRDVARRIVEADLPG